MAAWAMDVGDAATSQSGQDGALILMIPGAEIAFYDAQAGGAQVTDLLDALDTPTSTITADTVGEIPTFSGPDTDPETFVLWADGSGDGSGPRRRMIAADIGDEVGANKTTLLSMLDTVAALQNLAASSLGVVEYSSGWPTRPEDSRIIVWVGPTAPPIGGGYMQDGRDFWLNPTPAA
jgi:hypothetical protein